MSNESTKVVYTFGSREYTKFCFTDKEVNEFIDNNAERVSLKRIEYPDGRVVHLDSEPDSISNG